MRFLGTTDIALRAEKTHLEENIQKAEMSGAAKRDPNTVAQMRGRLAEIYNHLDPGRAAREQVKANQTRRFNPTMGDYDPLRMNLETAMALVDRKYGNTPGYDKARDTLKYTIQNQLSSPTPIDAISVAGRARDTLAQFNKKDPGGAKGASLESRRNLVDAQKTKVSDLEGMTNPYDVAMTLIALQNQGGMDRPIGGGRANQPNISPYGTSLPAQAMAAAGMVTDQMRPSESIPSVQPLIGKKAGAQVDAFVKSFAGMFDPATLATPISGAADMADLAFSMLPESSRADAIKALKGATPDEQNTFIARLLGMGAAGFVQGKIGNFAMGKIGEFSKRPLPQNLENLVQDIAANAPKTSAASDVSNIKVSFRPKAEPKPEGKFVTANPAPDQIGLAQAANMKRPAKPTDFTVGQEVKAPKKNGSEVAAKVTDVTDYSVGIETANGTKKFYSPEDAKTILKSNEPVAPTKATPVATQMAPEDIQVHPSIQFKGKAKSSKAIVDLNGNVTDTLKSVNTYNVTQGGPLLVWESNSGKRFVVDGHHRLELAKRAANFVDDTPTGQVDVPRQVPVNVIKEADGWTLDEAQFKGMMANLRDGKAEALDAALVLRKRGINADQIDGFFTKEGVTVKAALSKEIKGSMGLSNPAFERAMASFDIDQKAASGVGSIDGLTPEQQLAALGILEKGDHDTFKEGAVIAQKLKDRGAGTVTQAPSDQMGFGDMFGDGGPDPFGDYLSTIGTEATLQSMAEKQITKQFRDLNAPLNADLLDGEFINADLRKQLKDKLGGSQSKAIGKVDFLFQVDQNFQRYVSEQAQKVMNGDVSENQAANEIAQAAIDKIGTQSEGDFIRGAIQPGTDSGSNGGLPPGPPDPGSIPGSPDPGKPGGIKGPKNKRQQGSADVKVLAGVAAATAGGSIVYFWKDINKAIEENNLADVRNTILKAGLATTATTLIFQGVKSGAIRSFKGNDIDPFRVVLDPKSLAKLSEPGPFKSALVDVLSTNDLYRLKSARAFGRVEETAKNVFGKSGGKKVNPADHPVYREWNRKFRDHVEQNVAQGKKWNDGVPKEFADFAQSAITEMDDLLNQWEKLGGRIKVKNDGTQHTKMEPGASIRLKGGAFAEFVGVEETPNGVAIKTKVIDPSEFADVNPEDLTYTIRPGEEFGRPVSRIGEAYVPRVYTRRFIEQLVEGDPQFREALNQATVKAGGSPISDSEFVTLQDMAKGFAETESATSINSFLANLERERNLPLAKFEYMKNGERVVVDPYENSYFDATRKYLDRAAKRVAIAETLGIESDILAKVIDGIRGVDYEGADYLTTLVGRLFDMGPKARNYKSMLDQAARVEGQYQATTKLLGGTSAISQFSDIIVPLTEVGITKTYQGIRKLMKDKDFRSDIDVFNGGTNAWLREFSDIEHTGNSITKASSQFIDYAMTALQVKSMDKMVKRINTASVVTRTEELMRRVEDAAKNGKALTETEKRAMDRYGLTKWQEQIVAKGTDAMMSEQKFQADVASNARTFQYSGAAEDLPLWMSSPAGSMFMRFKKPWYVATKNLLQSAMNEATQGNFTPMARLVGYSVVVGSGAQYMKDIIKMAGLDEETRDMFKSGDFGGAIKRMFVDVPSEKNYLGQSVKAIREDRAHGLMQMIGLVGQTMYESGSTGIGGEVFPLNQRTQSDVRQFNSWERFEPITSQSVRRIAGLIGGYAANGVNEKTNANAYEIGRSEVIPARRVFDFFNVKPEEVVAREGARKIKAENAKIPKDAYNRREQLKYQAMPEKMDRRIKNRVDKYNK